MSGRSSPAGQHAETRSQIRAILRDMPTSTLTLDETVTAILDAVTPDTVRMFSREGSVTVDDDPGNYDLIIKGRRSGDRDPAVVLRIATESIPTFVRMVTDHGMVALSAAATAMRYGDCATCGNTRLVDVMRFGQPSNDYCPDCRVKVDPPREDGVLITPAGFTDTPRIWPAGFRTEDES